MTHYADDSLVFPWVLLFLLVKFFKKDLDILLCLVWISGLCSSLFPTHRFPCSPGHRIRANVQRLRVIPVLGTTFLSASFVSHLP